MKKDTNIGSAPAQDGDVPARGPFGDVLPGKEDLDPRTKGGLPPEKVEDRPNVGTVKPEDYPEQQ